MTDEKHKSGDQEPGNPPDDSQGSRLVQALDRRTTQDAGSEKTGENDLEFLCFQIKERPYAILLSEVAEVVNPARISDVPHTPDYIRGVFNRHGRTTAVLDLAAYMGMGAEESPRRLVVISADDLEAAIPVSDILGIISLPRARLEPALAHLEHGSGFITGQISREEDVLSVITARILLENTQNKNAG